MFGYRFDLRRGGAHQREATLLQYRRVDFCGTVVLAGVDGDEFADIPCGFSDFKRLFPQLSIGAASVVSFIAVAAVFAVVYGIGLWVEWRRRK